LINAERYTSPLRRDIRRIANAVIEIPQLSLPF